MRIPKRSTNLMVHLIQDDRDSLRMCLLYDRAVLPSRPSHVSCHFISQKLDSLCEVVLNSLALSGEIDLQGLMICLSHQRTSAGRPPTEDISGLQNLWSVQLMNFEPGDLMALILR